MTNDGIDPNTIIDVQSKQLLKARINAAGYLETHRRDQVKIVELGEEIVALEAALHTYINWVDILVAERDARIAELEAAGQRLLYSHEEYLRGDDRYPTDVISRMLAEFHAAFIDEVK